MTDLTHSLRQADWKANLSSLRRSIPLFFAFGRINYFRWAPIHYEECLNLENLHPKLFEAFNRGDFIVNRTSRRSSSVPVDQALEKVYNKPANSPGGVIGLTQKKESVAKWNLIKHEKMKYAKFIDDVCEFNAQDEYSTHQEFSSSTTASEESNIQTICQFLSQLGDIFDEGDFQNIVTGEILDNATKQFLLGCLESGDKLFYDYRKQSHSVEKQNVI